MKVFFTDPYCCRFFQRTRRVPTSTPRRLGPSFTHVTNHDSLAGALGLQGIGIPILFFGYSTCLNDDVNICDGSDDTIVRCWTSCHRVDTQVMKVLATVHSWRQSCCSFIGVLPRLWSHQVLYGCRGNDVYCFEE